MKSISVSRMNSFTSCPQAHHYAYNMNLAPISGNDALDLGTLVHSGLEYYYRHGTRMTIDAEGEVADKARSALMTYELFARMNDRFEVVDAEKEFSSPLEDVPGWQFNGIIDMVVRLQGGLWLVEHKTMAQHWSAQQQITTPQHPLYELAAEELYGEPIMGTIYNHLRITTRAGQWHTDIKRNTLPADAAVRAEQYGDMLVKIAAIDMGFKYRSPSKSCGWCRFYTLCASDLMGGDTASAAAEFYRPRKALVTEELMD